MTFHTQVYHILVVEFLGDLVDVFEDVPLVYRPNIA
jgi:hypothetical protein